ncbi:MAG: heme NO-binding domain-containing protein [Gammaproteobacteria bacterium]
MKGIVFNIFSDLVTDKFGWEMWDQLIEKTQPESEAAYTSAQVYPDGELIAYVTELSNMTGAPAADLIRVFGQYMMHKFKKMHPEFMEGQSAKSFLASVHDVIHVEVKKLHQDTILPTFEYEDNSGDTLTMIYTSERKLCHLAEGLVNGVSEIFEETIAIEHPQCMHDGAENCRLELRFG